MNAQQQERVTFILPSFAGGGAERIMISLANGLDRERYAPEIITFTEDGPLRESVSDRVPVTGLNCPRLRNAILPLRRELIRRHPEFVVTTMGYINLAVLMFCRPGLKSSRIIIREANAPAATQKAIGWPWLVRQLYRHYYGRADAVVCPSRLIAGELNVRFGVPKEKLRELKNPVDVDLLRTAAAKPVRRPGAGPRFVAAGRLTSQKGFARLIDMFAQLPAECHLTILGEGPALESLCSRVNDKGLGDRVEFAGFKNCPWPYYSGADAFLLASLWEGMPNAALEALACGTRVIATPEAGGISEIAKIALPAALTIADIGEPYIAALGTVCPDPISTPRASLLPKAYYYQAVSRSFESLLRTVAQR